MLFERTTKTMNEKKVYIAGPMTGRERVEYIQHFRRAEEYLEDRGYTVAHEAHKEPWGRQVHSLL